MANIVKLPRLPVGWEKIPRLFPRYWDEAMTSIERVLNEILSIPAIESGLEGVQTDLADTQTTLTSVELEVDALETSVSSLTAQITSLNNYRKIVSSYIDPTSFLGNVLSCDSSGVITVLNHTRRYGDGSSVAVAGGTFSASGAGGGDVVRVYYNDSGYVGGAVTFLHSIDPAAPPVQLGAVHSVGVVEVPLAGTNAGAYIRPPGFVYN